MLSKITLKEIENKFGQEIRYPTDCEALSGHISMVTKERVSTSTLKRILGFVKGTKEPRLFTLDVLAKYLGYENWDLYIEKFSNTNNSEFLNIEQVDVSMLDVNDIVCFSYEPNREVTMRYLGDFIFEVEVSQNSKLLKSDKIKVLHIVKHYPLLINSVVRNEKDLGQLKAGKVSGITNIVVTKAN
ncbi:MAG: hypothetical protein WCK02_00205 [Bacteroidota bacterium]